MRNKFKEINIKSGTNYFFDDMINIKNIDTNVIKIRIYCINIHIY